MCGSKKIELKKRKKRKKRQSKKKKWKIARKTKKEQ